VGKRIKVSSKRLQRVRIKSQTLRRLDPQEVAKALGAELVETGLPESLMRGPRARAAEPHTSNGKPRRHRSETKS
jgi:hypothetical protein